jgi:antirestriction protein ArdC
VTTRSELAEEIGAMTEAMEKGDNPPSYEEAYYMLLRAFLEINRLDQRIRVLEGRPS